MSTADIVAMDVLPSCFPAAPTFIGGPFAVDVDRHPAV
jgi:hypothetical protein